jgi:hypothetical protein
MAIEDLDATLMRAIISQNGHDLSWLLTGTFQRDDNAGETPCAALR